jgi:thioredoxin 1
MAPILDEMREEFDGRMDVRFIDVRKDRDAASLHGVRVIPTQIFFDEHGHELFRHQGFYSRDDILAKWSELGYAFDGPGSAEATATTRGASDDG